VLASVLQKKMRLEAPLCRKHHNHWLVRNLVIGLSFLAIFLMSIGLFVLAAIQEQRRGGDAFFGLACGGTVVSLLAWLILTAILSMTTVRAKEITEDEMHLTGVSAEFADALAEIPYVDDEDDDYDRPRRRRERRAPPRYEDDPDERRSRRPPPRDDRVYDDEDQPRARGTPPDAFEERD